MRMRLTSGIVFLLIDGTLKTCFLLEFQISSIITEKLYLFKFKFLLYINCNVYITKLGPVKYALAKKRIIVYSYKKSYLHIRI